MFRFKRPRGQGLVEFALILPALLMIVLSIIEGALLFQSYLAIQHAAREAARYAVAYQPPITYSEAQGKILLQGGNPGNPAYKNESETEWYTRRVGLIKQRALDQAMGIRTVYPALDESSFTALYSRPGFFGVRVWGFPSHDRPELLDHPGLQGLPVRVRVYYRWEALDPLIGAIVPNGVMITGEAVMINEGVQVGSGSVAPPTFAPPPTVAPPTGVPTDDPSTPEPTPTGTWTPTPVPATPTATPDGAYVILTDVDTGDEKDPWLLEELDELRRAQVELRQHSGAGPYRIYWTDNCGRRTYLNLNLTPSGGTVTAQLPDPSGLLPGGSYLCGSLTEGETYQADISSCDATQFDCSNAANDTATATVNVMYPFSYPDLVVQEIIVPTPAMAGAPLIVDVVIANEGDEVVTDTFDIDIYADPGHTPILKGQPGLIANGVGSAKQWYGTDIPPGGTATIQFAMTLATGGEHTLWAQVDTSFTVEESDDENNITGPIEFSAYCSDQCDDFDASPLDSQWEPLSTIGTAPGGSGSASVTAEGELRIEGLGANIWDAEDGRFFLLHQGAYSGNFDMSVKVTDYPRDESGSMAGLMVRESTATGARYVAVGVVNVSGSPHFQAAVRDAPDVPPFDPCGGTVPIGSFGDGVWVRIARERDEFTLYTSFDGETWDTASCAQVTVPGFSGSAVPGIFAAPMPNLIEGDTGWLSPTQNAADAGGDGNGFEDDPEDAYNDGGGRAVSWNNGNGGSSTDDRTDRHQYYGFGINLPAGAVVLGIEVREDWWLNNRSGANRLRTDLSWDGGSSWSELKTDSWERTYERSRYPGGDSDLWGRAAWSVDDLLDANFRVRLHAYSSRDWIDFYLDYVAVEVTYGEPDPNAAPDDATFDTFQLCPLDPVSGSTRSRPPLLRECGSVLSNADFVAGDFTPWVDGLESAAVVPDGTFSCDLDGRLNYGFSMYFRCDRLPYAPLYQPLHPWAYQEFTVPSFISTTEPVTVSMDLSLYYGVPAVSEAPPGTSPGMEPYIGTYGRVEDVLQAQVTGLDDTALTFPAAIGNGGLSESDRDKFHDWTGDLAPLFQGGDTLVDHIGETLRLRIDAPNVDTNGDGHEDGDTQFYIDQVRCEICTTVKPPDPSPGTVRRLGGDILVLVEGLAQPMEGVDVWAMQLPDGTTPPESLAFFETYSIHDSTYNFYNLPPGTYRIYAQVWVSGVLYTASETVVLDSGWIGQERLDVDLTLH